MLSITLQNKKHPMQYRALSGWGMTTQPVSKGRYDKIYNEATTSVVTEMSHLSYPVNIFCAFQTSERKCFAKVKKMIDMKPIYNKMFSKCFMYTI